jgi:hypothetical protein
MDIPGTGPLNQNQTYTLKDWKTWPEGERWELIEGKVWNMSPAPRIIHQRILLSLAQQLSQQLKGKPCEPFIAPVDVFLEGTDHEEKTTVVQPDLMVVCDPSKCKDQGFLVPQTGC